MRLFTRQPMRYEVRIRQPAQRLDQRLDGLGHEAEIKMSEIVVGFVISGRRTPSTGGVRDHAFQSQRIVIGALEEVLLGIRIIPQQRPMLHKSWTEIRTVPAREQHLALRHLRILITDHLELQIRSNVLERDWRMFAEVRRPKSSQFFAAVTDKINRSLERLS